MEQRYDAPQGLAPATAQPQASCVRAVPAQWQGQGFRLLTLREFRAEPGPPAFAWMEQHLLRAPQRLSRHGLFFAATFCSDVMAWLSAYLGRPSVRAGIGPAQRNPLWPSLVWQGEERAWPDGARTIEWFVDVSFPQQAAWTAFHQRWGARLMGQTEAAPKPSAGTP